MSREDNIFIFCCVMYIAFAIMAMDFMGHLTHDIKVAVYKHYNVPLKDDK